MENERLILRALRHLIDVSVMTDAAKGNTVSSARARGQAQELADKLYDAEQRLGLPPEAAI